MGNFTFGMYSGYLPITGTKKALHYLLVESQNNTTKDPLLVWFNGGPGCSSMLGFAAEHGQFVVPDGADNFTKNEYSWNKEASMLYIESPAGVGYSICEEDGGCTFNDDTSAADNLVAILNFFEKFPEYK